MNIADKVARVLEEAPGELRQPLITFLKQHQSGEELDLACLFVAIVELQDQVNRLTHENEQLREGLSDIDSYIDKLDTRIDGQDRVLFR